MKIRPRSVTIISWIFIIAGILAILGIVRRLWRPGTGQQMQKFILQNPGYFVFTHVAAVIAIIFGICMLFGFSWARWLLFVWFIQATIADTMVSPAQFWKPSLLFVLAICFLFRQPASDYFRSAKQEK